MTGSRTDKATLWRAMQTDPIEVAVLAPDGTVLEQGIAYRNVDGTATYAITVGGMADHITVNGVPVPLAHLRRLVPEEMVTVPNGGWGQNLTGSIAPIAPFEVPLRSSPIPPDLVFAPGCPYCRGGGVGLRALGSEPGPYGTDLAVPVPLSDRTLSLEIIVQYPCWCAAAHEYDTITVRKPFTVSLDTLRRQEA